MKHLAKVGDDPADLIRSFISDHHIVKAGSVTVERFAEIYMEKHARPFKRSWHKDEQNLKNHILPAWRNKRLSEITRQDMSELHRRIGRDRPYAANRVKELVATMWKQATIWGYLPDNHPSVVLGVREFKERPRDQFIPKEKLSLIANAISALPNQVHREGLKFLLYTGLRVSEAINLKWSDVDLEIKELKIELTKSGRPHRLPLSTPAVELPRLNNPYVFPGRQPGKPISRLDKAWHIVRKKCGLPDIRLHDLRRTAGSYLIQDTHSLPLVGEILNQTTAHVTQIYSRYDKASIRNALERLGASLEAHLEESA